MMVNSEKQSADFITIVISVWEIYYLNIKLHKHML